MTTDALGAWKFWVERHERLLCFIVALPDEKAAEAQLLSREGGIEVLDREPVPARVLPYLRMKHGDVSGWSSLSMPSHPIG